MQLSLVIPSRNEAARIAATLVAYANEFARDAEIIVVVNGSHDSTAAIAKRIALDHENVEVIEVPEAIGKGGAVRIGFARARGTHVGFVDADMATSPQEYRRILSGATDADGAIGSRWAPGAKVVGRSWLRALMSRGFVFLARALLRLPYRDSQCGAKVFHRRLLPLYLAESRVCDLAFDVELLLILTRAGAKLVEIPTTWVSVPGSTNLGSPMGFLRHGIAMLRSLLRLRFAGSLPATSMRGDNLSTASQQTGRPRG